MKKPNKFFLIISIYLSFFLQSEESIHTSHLDTIVLGSGCFWGAEKGYESLAGVENAVSGYSDGYGIKPNYRSITKLKNKFNKNNFAEVVEVTYNKSEISLESLNKFIYKDDMIILDIDELKDESICSTSSNFDKEAFFHLGLSTIKSGKYFEFKEGCKFDTPIQILNVYNKNTEELRISSFNIFKLNQGNNISIIEQDINEGSGSFNLSLNKFICADNTILNHSMMYDDSTESNYLGYNYYELERNVLLNIDSMNINSTFNKNFIEIDLNREGSEVKINILNLARNEQHLDNNILVNHNAEHCISVQNVRNILNDQATCVFNGKVVVADGAQKTDSNQSNKNLLLSQNATAHSNPQLEIYADDVACGHGSTTGALDQDSIFYLRARGIKETDANNILVKAFAKEILQEFINDNIRNLSENNLDHWINGQYN